MDFLQQIRRYCHINSSGQIGLVMVLRWSLESITLIQGDRRDEEANRRFKVLIILDVQPLMPTPAHKLSLWLDCASHVLNH